MKANDFKVAMKLANKVKNNSLPILDNALFLDGKIIFTDLENYVIFKTDIKGSFLLDIKTLYKISQKVKGEVNFEQEGKTVHLTIDGVRKFNFSDLSNIDDYPVLPEMPTKKLRLNYSDLLRSFKYCSDDELRPVLCSVFISEHVVATDAHLLVYRKSEEIPGQGILIASHAKKYLGSDLVSFAYSDKWALFKFADYSLITKQTEGKYPSYMSVVPVDQPGLMKIKKSDLLEQIDFALITANSAKCVKLSAQSGKLSISSKDIDYSRGYESGIAGEYNGVEIAIGFDGERLKNSVSDLPEELSIAYTDSARAVVINGESLLMPTLLNS